MSRKWYATLRHPKMHPHIEFGIPTSKKIGDMHRTLSGKDGQTDIVMTINTKSYGQGQGHSDPKMVCDTRPSQDASTHQIWDSYLKEYRRYAPDSKREGGTDSAITICLPKFLLGHKKCFHSLFFQESYSYFFKQKPAIK